MVPLFKVFMSEEAISNVNEVLRSGFIAQGPKSDLLEKELQKFFSHSLVATVNSGTSALQLALYCAKHYWNLNPAKTQVISTPLTCAASNMAIAQEGFAIKWADVEQDGLNVDLYSVEALLDRNTRILMLVHWGGIPVNLYTVEFIKEEYYRKYGQDLIVIEDCAHAWGARYEGNMLGTKNIGCYSCQAIKTLTTGDGGVVLSPNTHFNKLVRKCRWFGLDRDNKQDFRSGQDIEIPGYKFHMNDIAASLGLGNLGSVKTLVELAQMVAHNYNNSIKNPAIKIIHAPTYSNPSYWLYTILVENRERFIKYMEENGVQAHFVHSRNDKLTCFKQYQAELPNLDKVANRICCIPCGWWITEKDMKHIIKVANEYKP